MVLTGGGSRRMGRDKATLDVGGVTLLERTLSQVPAEVPVVVAGPVVPVARSGVRFAQEDPPGGGPVAGLDAALAVVETAVVVVLATDLPLVGELPEGLARALLDEDPVVDAVIADDASGRLQPLCAAYRVDALRRAIGSDARGASVHSVVDRLRVSGLSILHVSDDLQRVGVEPTWDVDTPEDLARLGEILRPRDDG